MSRRQQVFVVTWERCIGSENGETCGVVGVYRTTLAALRAIEREEANWRSHGSVVIVDLDGSKGDEGDEDGIWDICLNMRKWPLEG